MRTSERAQMLALLRYHYGDPHIDQQPEETLLGLLAELRWVKEQEAKTNTHGPAN